MMLRLLFVFLTAAPSSALRPEPRVDATAGRPSGGSPTSKQEQEWSGASTSRNKLLRGRDDVPWSGFVGGTERPVGEKEPIGETITAML